LKNSFRPIITILIGISCLSSNFCACNILGSATVAAADSQDNLARELRIYKEALVHGGNEQIQTDTAITLLVRGDKQSKAMLLESLTSEENIGARRAVCRGLIQSVALGDAIGSKKEFLEPLIGMLVDKDGIDAKLAAEALLIFQYRDLRPRLITLVKSAELNHRIRLNVIYALQLRPDPDAISDIINLIDEPDKEISQAAEKALQEAFGIPVGTERQVWEQILKDLQKKSPNDIRRDRLLQQERKVRLLQSDRDVWLNLYLGSLDKEYESADEVAKGKFLTDKLSSEYTAVKLWTLDKISHRSGAAVLPEDFGLKLLTLISDADKQVRLQTAKVLSKMSELNPAESLLTQLKTEEPGQVRLAMFEAIGEACYYAFSPGSSIKLPAEIKAETLDLAMWYINRSDANEARAGAEVIRKLLELNGLDKAEIDNYLTVILNRYQLAKSEDTSLQPDLLNVMARLCSQPGSFREGAVKIFKQAFIDGLDDVENPRVRQAAAAGITKAEAFRILKEKGFVTDSNESARMHVIELAARAGKTEDLDWLAEKLASNGEGEIAYRSMIEILSRQNASVVESWAGRFAKQDRDREKIIELYEMTLKKAKGLNDEVILANTRRYLLKAYLRDNQEKALGIVTDVLAEIDISSRHPVALELKSYLGLAETSAESKTALLQGLGKIKTAERPDWKALLETLQPTKSADPKPVASKPAAPKPAANKPAPTAPEPAKTE
jgi:HEAT repeat protein